MVADFPISYPSIEPMHALAKSASYDSVKILLARQGADEIFLGYTSYLDLIKLDSVTYEEWKNFIFFGVGIDNISLLEQLTFKNRSIIEDSNSWKYLESIKFTPKHVQLSIFDLRERTLQLLRKDNMAGMFAGVEIWNEQVLKR